MGSGGAGSWSVGSNLGSNMTAGAGILVYAFADNNNDGTDDLPVTLSVSGTENSGDVRYPALGTIEDGRYGFAGNPYYSTIDWDDVDQSNNISATVYIHDDAKSGGAGYISLEWIIWRCDQWSYCTVPRICCDGQWWCWIHYHPRSR